MFKTLTSAELNDWCESLSESECAFVLTVAVPLHEVIGLTKDEAINTARFVMHLLASRPALEPSLLN